MVAVPAGDAYTGEASVDVDIPLPAAGVGTVLVRVRGSVTVEMNPDYLNGLCQDWEYLMYNRWLCEEKDRRVGTWGPLGYYDDYGIFFDIITPNGSKIVQSGSVIAGDSSQAVLNSGGVAGGRIVRVWRKGYTANAYWKGATVPRLRVQPGGQTLAVETLGPASVSADKEFTQAAGDTVTFTAGANGGSITAAYWRFVADDTLDVPGASSGAWVNPWCEGKTTCQWVPPSSGRMYVVGAMIDGQWWSGEGIASQVVWVGKSRLQLVCTPGKLPQGLSTTCTASTTPSVNFVVQSFSYSGAAVPQGHSGDLKSWTFEPQAVGSGTVTVTATVNGQLKTATAQVEVVCNFFTAVPPDPLLNPTGVHQGLQQLWDRSDPTNPSMFDRQERGGWFVRTDGELEIVPWQDVSADRCTLTIPWDEAQEINNTPGRQVEALVHTHPHDPGTYPNPKNCQDEGGDIIVMKHGMSPADRKAAQILPSYVLDRDHVHRWTKDKKWYNSPDTHTRNKSCTPSQP